MKKIRLLAVLTALAVFAFGFASCDFAEILNDMNNTTTNGSNGNNGGNVTGTLTPSNYLPDDFKSKTVKAWFIDELGAFIMFTDNTWVETVVYEGEGIPYMKGTYTSSEITVTHFYTDKDEWKDYGTVDHIRPYTISGNTLTIQLVGSTQTFKKK